MVVFHGGFMGFYGILWDFMGFYGIYIPSGYDCYISIELMVIVMICPAMGLQNRSSVFQQRTRVYVTDAKSVYDYLQKDATSTSTDKTVLREFLRTRNFSSVETEQNTQLKEKKQADRQVRDEKRRADDGIKVQQRSPAEENTGM